LTFKQNKQSHHLFFVSRRALWKIPPNKLKLKKFFDCTNQWFSLSTKIFPLLPTPAVAGIKSEVFGRRPPEKKNAISEFTSVSFERTMVQKNDKEANKNSFLKNISHRAYDRSPEHPSNNSPIMSVVDSPHRDFLSIISLKILFLKSPLCF
jgi:hypothetical protein